MFSHTNRPKRERTIRALCSRRRAGESFRRHGAEWCHLTRSDFRPTRQQVSTELLPDVGQCHDASSQVVSAAVVVIDAYRNTTRRPTWLSDVTYEATFAGHVWLWVTASAQLLWLLAINVPCWQRLEIWDFKFSKSKCMLAIQHARDHELIFTFLLLTDLRCTCEGSNVHTASPAQKRNRLTISYLQWWSQGSQKYFWLVVFVF